MARNHNETRRERRLLMTEWEQDQRSGILTRCFSAIKRPREDVDQQSTVPPFATSFMLSSILSFIALVFLLGDLQAQARSVMRETNAQRFAR